MALLAYIEIDYYSAQRHKIAAMDRDTYERVRQDIPALNLSEWQEGKNEAPTWYGVGSSAMIDLETDGKVIAELGIDFKVKRFKGAYFAGEPVGRYQTQIKGAADMNVGTLIQVAIPDLALMHITEVKVLEDCCTDALNDELECGWRIIAVCPPNSQRRPDYILGRRT